MIRAAFCMIVFNTIVIIITLVIEIYNEMRPVVSRLDSYLEKSIIHNGDDLVTVRSMKRHQQCLIRVNQFITTEDDLDDVLWQSPTFESIRSGLPPGEDKYMRQHIKIPTLPVGSYEFQVRSEFVCAPSGRWHVIRGPMLRFTVVD